MTRSTNCSYLTTKKQVHLHEKSKRICLLGGVVVSLIKIHSYVTHFS
jgi:hypothetical protein